MMTFCAAAGCGALVTRGRCPIHAGALDRARGSRQARGYTNRWGRRAAIFRARYPLCGMRPGNRPPVMSACYDADRITLGAQVDHVVPHKGDPDLFWDELGNWQTLCASCGARKSKAGL